MIYGLSAITQISNFLSASGLGLLVALIYYGVSFVRSAVSESKVAYFIADMIFSLGTAFLFFTFFHIYTFGEVRWELIFSAGVSFFAFSYCFRILFSSAYKKAVKLFAPFLRAFFSPVGAMSFLFKKIWQSLRKNLRKKKK